MSDQRIDPKSGYCPEMKTYHSFSTAIPLPPENASLSISDYVFSLLHSNISSSNSEMSTSAAAAVINSATGDRISYFEFMNQVESLAFSLQTQIGLSKGDTAFILSQPNPQIPILYFSLFSLGVVVSPSNPIGTVSEISHQLNLSKSVIAFATSKTAHKIIPSLLRYPTILLDSPDFQSMKKRKTTVPNKRRVEVRKELVKFVLSSRHPTAKL